MSEAAQILLYIVILVLTILLIVLGIQVLLILKELRSTVKKTNRVLDNTEDITSSIKNPLNSFSSLLMGLKAGSSLMNIIKRVDEEEEKKKNGK